MSLDPAKEGSTSLNASDQELRESRETADQQIEREMDVRELSRPEVLSRMRSDLGFSLVYDPTPIKVDSVVIDGPAMKSGLTRSDVVVEVDGEQVQSVSDFAAYFQRWDHVSAVRMTVLREGVRLPLILTPSARAGSMNLPGLSPSQAPQATPTPHVRNPVATHRLTLVVALIVTSLTTLLPWSEQVTAFPATQTNLGLSHFAWGSLTFVLCLASAFQLVIIKRPYLRYYTAAITASAVGVIGTFVGLSQIHQTLTNVRPGIFVTMISSIVTLIISITTSVTLRTSGLGDRGSPLVSRITNQVKKELGHVDERSARSTSGPNSIPDELRKFAELKEQGLISQEEYDVQRDRLLK